MQTRLTSLLQDQWPLLLSALPPDLNLDATARQFGAFTRRRGVPSAEALLRLALGYGPCGLSLRSTAHWAGLGAVADVADTSVLERLCKSGPWLAEIVRRLLSARTQGVEAIKPGRTIRLVDGSCLSIPGSTGTDWRLHAVYDLGRGGFSHVEVTDKLGGESLCRGAAIAGEIRVADRGYAKAPDLRAFLDGNRQADYIIRIGWKALRLLNGQGELFDLIGALRTTEVTGCAEHRLLVAGDVGRDHAPLPVRLIIIAKSPEAAQRARKVAQRRASKTGCKLDERSLIAADYLMLITSLDEAEFTVAEIADIYRLRWQIELAFKRLKSILQIDHLRARSPDLVMTAIQAHLIAALIIDDLTQEVLDSPPCTL